MVKGFFYRAAAISSIALVAACSDATAPQVQDGGYTVAKSKPSSAVLENDKVVSDLFFADPCSGEPIVATGTTHILISATTTPSGNTLLNNDSRFVLSGVGALTGTKYNGSSVNTSSLTLTSGSAIVSESTTELKVISQGRADNFSLTIKSHVTFNSNGVPTATTDVVRTDCK